MFIKNIPVPAVLLMYCPSLQTARQANRTNPVVSKQQRQQKITSIFRAEATILDKSLKETC